MNVEYFLLGVIATSSIIASMFFFKFWRHTRDSLFLCLGIAFLIEGMNRIAILRFEHPNEASPWIYIVRLAAYLIILVGILRKNLGRP